MALSVALSTPPAGCINVLGCIALIAQFFVAGPDAAYPRPGADRKRRVGEHAGRDRQAAINRNALHPTGVVVHRKTYLPMTEREGQRRLCDKACQAGSTGFGAIFQPSKGRAAP